MLSLCNANNVHLSESLSNVYFPSLADELILVVTRLLEKNGDIVYSARDTVSVAIVPSVRIQE